MKPQLVMLPRSPGIYRLTNDRTGMLYIGSAVNVRERCTDHVRQLNKRIHHNPHLQAAWNKGDGAFSFEYLVGCRRDETVHLEQWWLNFYGASRLYNVSLNPTASMLGRTHSAAAREKIRAANIGKPHRKGQVQSPEERAKRSAARRGKPHPHSGHPISAETRQKIGASLNRARLFGEENPFFGKKHSMETRLKMSRAKCGVRWSAARRAAHQVRTNG